MLKGILAVTLATVLVFIPLQQASANSDTAADVLRVALPAAAFGIGGCAQGSAHQPYVGKLQRLAGAGAARPHRRGAAGTVVGMDQ